MPDPLVPLGPIGWGAAASAGGGPTYPRTATVTATGSTNLNTLGIPAGVDVKFELWGGGGGGGGKDTGVAGGAGGGGGGYIAGTIPAALWAEGGTVSVGAGGAGGAATVNGTNGVNTVLTLDAVARATAGLGHGGPAGFDAPAAGGTNTAGAGVTITANRTGWPSTSVDGHNGTPGGASIIGGYGAGGNGGDDPGDAATAGANGAARFSY